MSILLSLPLLKNKINQPLRNLKQFGDLFLVNGSKSCIKYDIKTVTCGLAQRNEENPQVQETKRKCRI